jgi:hypothetical protein
LGSENSKTVKIVKIGARGAKIAFLTLAFPHMENLRIFFFAGNFGGNGGNGGRGKAIVSKAIFALCAPIWTIFTVLKFSGLTHQCGAVKY